MNEEYYKDIPKLNSLGSMEGVEESEELKPRSESNDAEYPNFNRFRGLFLEAVKLFEEEYSQSIIEGTSEEIKEKKERRFFYFIKQYFAVWTEQFHLLSVNENERLLEYLRDFGQKSGLSVLDTELAFYIGRMFYKDGYSEEELLDLGFKINSLSFWNGLITEHGELLNLANKSDDEIVELGKRIIQSFLRSSYDLQKPEESFEEFELGLEGHFGYHIWNEFVKFLKLSGDTQTLIDAGVRYGRPNIWPAILKKIGREAFQTIPIEERNKIKRRIAESVGCDPLKNLHGVVGTAVQDYLLD